MELTHTRFGTLADGTDVDRFTLSDSAGTDVAVLTYGGILQEVRVPDRDGRPAGVTLGFGDLEGYTRAAYRAGNPYFGAVVGRYANRIAGGRFTLDGRAYRVPPNNGPNALHGGPDGFDARVWEAEALREASAVGVRLRLTSPDGDQGFPGTLAAEVTYRLEPGRLRIDYRATTDAPTVVNLTNHTYWNLAGAGSGTAEHHVLEVPASRFTPVDATQIPLGAEEPVAGTPFDFRVARAVGHRLRDGHPQLVAGRGYDHHLVLDGADGLALAARLHDPRSGRMLEVRTTEPGVQVYTGNFLDGTLRGHGGRQYRQGDAIALETQHAPDSPNRPDVPSTVLRPGETYASRTVFAFATDRRPA
jgi:aldose 1-epimerase